MDSKQHFTPVEAVQAMIRIRAWQHVLNERLKLGHFKVPIHLAFGYEALAVALAGTLQSPDRVILHHRNIAYQLALAKDLRPIMDEFLQRPSGGAGGALGSMNLAMKGSQIIYTTSILGNGLPVATGVALHQKLQEKGGVTFVVVGDGGIEEGACYEAMIFAQSQGLPLIVILENNDQSMSSSVSQRRCAVDWRAFTASFGVSSLSARGHSLAECDSALGVARRICLANSSPVVVEVNLHAYNQHAGASPGWAGDPKVIGLSDGPFLKPYNRDSLFCSDLIAPDETHRIFWDCVAECDGETLNPFAHLLPGALLCPHSASAPCL
jgi:pyruvate dehydrogenase E1 component alpha subunit